MQWGWQTISSKHHYGPYTIKRYIALQGHKKYPADTLFFKAFSNDKCFAEGLDLEEIKKIVEVAAKLET